MEFNSVTDTLSVSELLCDTAVELPVEGEFTIPDYQPEIFKIVKTKAEPIIVQRITAGSRLTVDGYVRLTVLYQSGADQSLCSVTQKLPFSRQIELNAAVGEASTVCCRAAMGFLNCRAVNSRRIDARGTVEMELRTVSQYPYEAVCEPQGERVYCKQTTAEFVREICCEEKQFTLEETLAVDYGDCEEPVLLRCEAAATTDSVTVENGRAIVGGTVNLQLAFDLSSESEFRIKRVGFNLPFNQVLDIRADDGEYTAIAVVSVLSCGAAVADEGTAEANVTCAIDLRLYEKGEAQLLEDAFSTVGTLSLSRKTVERCIAADSVRESFGVRFSFERPNATLIDYFISSNECSAANGMISGKATLCCLVCDERGEISAVEREFEYSVPLASASGSVVGELSVVFSVLEAAESGGLIHVKCEGSIVGRLLKLQSTDTVREAAFDPNCPPPQKTDAALVVCYADAGESVWEIAKRFNTSPEEIVENNDLEIGDGLQPRPLLIPIIG